MDVTAARTITSGLKRSHSTIAENRLFKYERLSKRTTKANVIRARDYFLHERSFSNVKILIDEQIVWCDKASLAAASPVLREVLLKKNNDMEILPFDDIALDEFLSMLEFIYPLFNPEINEENIASLIRLADRFQFGEFSRRSSVGRTFSNYCPSLDVLQQACQFYVTNYLSTIRHVFAKCQPFPVEGVCCVEQTGEHLGYNDRDLMWRNLDHLACCHCFFSLQWVSRWHLRRCSGDNGQSLPMAENLFPWKLFNGDPRQ